MDSYRSFFVVGVSLAAVSLLATFGCDQGVECGPNTVEEDGYCVAVDTRDDSGSDANVDTAGDGTSVDAGDATDGDGETGPPPFAAEVELLEGCCGIREPQKPSIITGKLPKRYAVQLVDRQGNYFDFRPSHHSVEARAAGDTENFDISTNGKWIRIEPTASSGSLQISAEVETPNGVRKTGTESLRIGPRKGTLEQGLGHEAFEIVSHPSGTDLEFRTGRLYPFLEREGTVVPSTHVDNSIRIRPQIVTEWTTDADSLPESDRLSPPESSVDLSVISGPGTIDDANELSFSSPGTVEVRMESSYDGIDPVEFEVRVLDDEPARYAAALGVEESGVGAFFGSSRRATADLSPTEIVLGDRSRNIDPGTVSLEDDQTVEYGFVAFHAGGSGSKGSAPHQAESRRIGYHKPVAPDDSKLTTAGDTEAVDVGIEEDEIRGARNGHGIAAAVVDIAGIGVPIVFRGVLDDSALWNVSASPESMEFTNRRGSCKSVSVTVSSDSETMDLAGFQNLGVDCWSRAFEPLVCDVSKKGIEVCDTGFRGAGMKRQQTVWVSYLNVDGSEQLGEISVSIPEQ